MRHAAARMVAIGAVCSLALVLSCTPSPVPLAGEGAIAALSPTEGTIGTEITISGTNLGNIAGEVLVGPAKAKVLQWSETEVVARVAGSLAAGEYAVTVKPWWETPLTYSAFTIGEPELSMADFHPKFLSGGETLTLKGKYLGNTAGTIRLENRAGQSVPAVVSDWSMESVTFQVPTGLTGLWNLVVSNGVATGIEHAWCTFNTCPTGAASESHVVSLVGVGHDTHEIPGAIQFDGALWTFGPAGSDQIWVDAYVNCESWENMPDPPGETNITPCPVVINDVLWLFSTARDGTIEYFTYTTASNAWTGPVKVPNVSTDDSCAVSVAYNNVDPNDRIELFYYSGGKIYRTYTDNRGGSWSTPAAVISGANWSPSALFWESAVYWDSTNSVTVAVPNATLVAYPYSNGIKLAYLQDGTVVHTVTKSTSSTLEYFQPELVDLGEDYLAVFCSDLNCQPAIRKLSKNTGQWESTWHPVDYDSNSPCWGVNGALGVQKVEDANSVGGYRYDTYLYLFYGTNGGHLWDDDEWTMKQVEYEGYYLEPNEPEPVDFAAEMAETFYLWPVIGIMDAPPFVLNGHSIDEYDCIPAAECTRAEFGIESGKEVDVGMGGSIGVYVETGEHCKAKLEISAEVNASVNKEITQTEKRVDVLFRSLEGNVQVFYLTPQVQTHTYVWYDHDSTATGKAFYVVELLKLALDTLIFDPRESPCPNCENMPESYWASFPTHASDVDLDRLNSYDTIPTESALFNSDGSWSSGGEGQISWTTDTSKSFALGGDIEFKVGKGGKIGGGVEGSFSMDFSVTTSLLTDSDTYLVNFDAANTGDVKHFTVDGYWLNGNDSGYWVPANRVGMGDEPWFITYYVTNVQQK